MGEAGELPPGPWLPGVLSILESEATTEAVTDSLCFWNSDPLMVKVRIPSGVTEGKEPVLGSQGLAWLCRLPWGLALALALALALPFSLAFFLFLFFFSFFSFLATALACESSWARD